MRTPMDLLKNAASSAPDKQLIFHEEYNSLHTTYSELYNQSNNNSELIRTTQGRIALLHLGSHADYVIWFWSALAAGAVPVVSTPLPADTMARNRHLKHLRGLLENPLVITTKALRDELDVLGDLRFFIIDNLPPRSNTSVGNLRYQEYVSGCNDNDIAFMMLTSGSTGGAKVVEITQAQVLASLDGKSHMLSTSSEDVFLNWIGFDHVACIMEIHLHAIAVCATQVHIDPELPTRDPLVWLQHLGTHRASIAFAPNFFLAAVVKALDGRHVQTSIDLSALRVVISGGEANQVSTGIAFNDALRQLGAKPNVVCPAFGMTETCAGSIYNLKFPELENQHGLDFCSVGTIIKSLRCRIANDEEVILGVSQHGELQLYGPALSQAYHNDAEKTKASFTNNGWFKTGDTGYMDYQANIVLVGRTKDSIIINGVNYFSHELEAVVEEAAKDYLIPSYTAVFPTWSEENSTEDVVVVFAASNGIADDAALSTALNKIAYAVFLYCSRKPRAMIPLPQEMFRKSSLGKLSRLAMKQVYEDDQIAEHDQEAKRRISNHRKTTHRAPRTELEIQIATAFAIELGFSPDEVDVYANFVDMGLDSIRLLRFKGHLQKQLGLKDIPIGTILANLTIANLAQGLSRKAVATEYDPVITLQSGKSNVTPIWFIHPGLGEVLVFLNISKYFSDRRVYALRAPGFSHGERMFSSIGEMTDVYMQAILRQQAQGPYILIGYSFGSMVAFETTKKLEAAGHEVFMGSLNGPPHIRWRMVQIDWCELFLNLSYFLGFLAEEEAIEKSAEFRLAGYTKAQILDEILAIAPRDRLINLDLNAAKLEHWANVSSELQSLAHNYDPVETVQHIDVFYARPLLAIGRDKQKWLNGHLHRWDDFCQEAARFHDSPGAHYTMLDPEHVFEMQKVLRAALRARGIL